jgi:hypothetical protein
MADTPSGKYWRWVLLGALLAYCAGALLLILQKPGLQYDEALLVLGSVQMRISPHELTLPHDPHTWVTLFGRDVPLMSLRYIGALKEYLCLPVFAIFGPQTIALRIVSMLLGLLGIWGIASLTRQHAGMSSAAIVAWVLALNPAYVDMTVFDNDAVAMSMAALGILCLAISRYLRNRTAAAACWVGAAIGLVVWARANSVWMLAALFGAALIVLGKRCRVPLAHAAAVLMGGIVGGLPFLIYQVVSKGGTWEALSMFSSTDTWRQRLFSRLIMFSETLLSDRQHRSMWDGPFMPGWQRWLFPTVFLMSCVVCLLGRSEQNQFRAAFARIAALAALLFAAVLFLSRVNLSEHHLIAMLPLAVVVTVLVCSFLAARYRWASVVVAALAAVYVSSAMYWQFSAIQGLRKTGGVGMWSEAIAPLAQDLLKHYADGEIKILDWGLQDNLFVLSDGRLHTREIYGGATRQQSGSHPWMEEIREGGVFLMNGPENRQFPAATEGFLQAVAETHPSVRWVSVRGRNGAKFAEIAEIEPNSLGREKPAPAGMASTISMGDPALASQLEGLHRIEEGGWRWSKREFAVTLGAPNLSGRADSRLLLQLYIPDSSIQKLGPITLTARVGTHVLAPETYRHGGRYIFMRDVDAAWLTPGPNHIDFTLDKVLPPIPPDRRELGIIVMGAALEAK